MKKYRLVKRFYFADGSYAEPQDMAGFIAVAHPKDSTALPRAVAFAPDFVESNTEFFGIIIE